MQPVTSVGDTANGEFKMNHSFLHPCSNGESNRRMFADKVRQPTQKRRGTHHCYTLERCREFFASFEKMIIYMDGGDQQHREPELGALLSWGVVAHHNDSTDELYGCMVRVSHRLQRAHEQLAFVQAVRYAHSKGVAPNQVSFFTDDSWVCSASENTRRSGALPGPEDNGYRLVRALCEQYFDDATFGVCNDYIQEARFTKVHGHKTTVYNLRCDDLSKAAQRRARGEQVTVAPFEEWLRAGFTYIDRDQVAHRWFPEFCGIDLGAGEDAIATSRRSMRPR